MPFDPEAYISDERAVAPQQVAQQPAPQQSIRMQQQDRMDAVLHEMHAAERQAAEAVQAQMTLMQEARNRFAKAALYEQMIEGQIFEGDDPVTLQVEEEFKAFAEERLMVLLGITPEPQKAKALDLLDEDELNVLKMFAAKLLGRDASIPKPAAAPKPQLAAPKQPGLAAPRAAPAPMAPAASLSAPKRGRGRPPGSGKNQRAAALAALQGESQPIVSRPTPVQHSQQSTAPADPSATSGVETRTVQLPNGQIREVAVQKGQIRPNNGPRPAPMPTPDDMVAQAAQQGEELFRRKMHAMRSGEDLAPIQNTVVPQFS